ncbi:MAG: DMT family transporter [Desulfobacterales bacterium]|nr:DMT family transporter [Desulfobacterales bacterium]
MIVISLFWGLGWTAMKVVLNEMGPWTFRSICLLGGGAGLLLLARAGGASLRVPAEDLKPLAVTALINVTGWHILSAYGVSLLNSGRAAIIAYTMPLWAVLLSRLLLGERVTPRRWGALIVGFAGLSLLVGPEAAALGSAPAGAAFMLAAAACWGAGTVLVKFFPWHMPGTLVMGWQLALGGIPVIIGAFLIEPLPAISSFSGSTLLALAFMLLGPIVLCQWAFFTVVQIFPANVAALSTLSIPVIGVFSGAMILGEALTWSELTALLMVLVSLGLTAFRPRGA